jgi:condensation domain-containing protein/phosphopantetheine binding protein
MMVAGTDDGLRQAVERAWAETLRVDAAGPDDNFFQQGGDSLLAIHMIALLARDGFDVPAGLLFTTADLAGFVAEAAATQPATAPARAPAGPLESAATVLPDQAWYLKVGRRYVSEPAMPVVSVLEVDERVTSDLMRTAVDHLWTAHQSLRTVVAGDGIDYLPPDAAPFSVRPDAPVAQLIADTAAGIDVAAGPLARWSFVPGGRSGGRLVFVGHFLVLDEYSLRVLTDDLDAVLGCLLNRTTPALPATTTSADWARTLRSYTRDLPEPDPDVVALMTEGAIGRLVPDSASPNTEATARYIELEQPADTLGILTTYAQSLRCSLQDVLAAVVAGAFLQWSGRDRLAFNSVLSGRNLMPAHLQPDLSRVVGRLATSALHVVDAAGGEDGDVATIATQIRDTREGGTHLIMKGWLDESSSLYGRLDRDPDLMFDFLGRSLSSPARLVRSAPTAPGEWHQVEESPDEHRFVKFYAVVSEDETSWAISIGYPGSEVGEEQAAQLADQITRRLKALGAA